MPETLVEPLYFRNNYMHSASEYLNQDALSNYNTKLYSILDKELDPSKDVLSISLFDTLAFRGSQSNLCLLWDLANLVSQSVSPSFPVSASDVFFARYVAEKRIRTSRRLKLDRREDVQMQINIHTSINICGDERLADDIGKLESHHLSGILTKSILSEYCINYRLRGARVVICVNSIFGERSIKGLLSNIGIEPDGFFGIYSSGDYRFKHTNTPIYCHALQDLGVAAVNILHVGHDFDQDFRCSREVGCRALWLPLSDKIEEERAMNRSKTESMIVESVGGAVDIEWYY